MGVPWSWLAFLKTTLTSGESCKRLSFANDELSEAGMELTWISERAFTAAAITLSLDLSLALVLISRQFSATTCCVGVLF